jgi:NAD(P)H-hydrate epimerase
MPPILVDRLPRLPDRPAEAHKGTFGKALVIAGSRGMSGAAVLSGLGALRGGAGLVHLAVPRGIQSIVAAAEPSYLVHGLHEGPEGRFAPDAGPLLKTLMSEMTAVAVGPGCGASTDLDALTLELFAEAPVPLVVDADGLNSLARSARRWPTLRPPAPRVLTPHPGEFARLLGSDTHAVQEDRQGLAVAFAESHDVVLLLKGAGTVITDGRRVAINQTGNPGMATGGSGDVLTGLITALLAQGLQAFEAAQLGAHLHGLAGDLAAAAQSEPGLIGSDLPRFLGKAWIEFLKPEAG